MLLMKSKAHKAFLEIKKRSKYRGIEFFFTEEEWIEWWAAHLGPDWLSLRGRKGDQYCMARKGDKGPYAPWNVECITQRQNTLDQAKNGSRSKLFGQPMRGSRHGRAKLTEDQAREIFASKQQNRILANRYGVSVTTVKRIKRKRVWKHLFEVAPAPQHCC